MCLPFEQVKSTEIEFKPNKLETAGEYTADTKTAGSCTLLVQVALPCMLFGAKESRAILKGGTNVPFSPPFDEMAGVFGSIAKKHFGIEFDLSLQRRYETVVI